MEELTNPNLDQPNPPAPENSLLGRVLSEAETIEKSAAKPLRIVNNILANLRSRERDVLVARYGLLSEQTPKETLESIGKRFSVTRERVRQIENAALKKIGKKYANQLKPLLKMINVYLSNNGGVMELINLASYLELDDQVQGIELDGRALKLVIDAYDKVVPLKKVPFFKEGWAETTVAQEDLLKIQDTVHKILQTIGHAMPLAELTRETHQQLPQIDPALIGGTLHIDPKVSLDNKGAWGMASWPSVVPKRIRDKVFLVLEEVGKPLHFEKIAQLISAKHAPEKPVLSRTVHNELIGDDRFVLVGRGIYALKKWGYKSGVVADVIKEAIVKAGRPLTVPEIVNEVMKSRQVKKNTIIANLQNHSLFRKVAKSTYDVVRVNPSPDLSEAN